MKTLFAIGLAALMTLPASADEVDNAFFLCRAADRTGLLSKPCEVSGWGSAVIMTIDMSSGEARQLCGMMQGYARDNNFRFNNKWKLEIKSPYSGGEPIAYCTLP